MDTSLDDIFPPNSSLLNSSSSSDNSMLNSYSPPLNNPTCTSTSPIMVDTLQSTPPNGGKQSRNQPDTTDSKTTVSAHGSCRLPDDLKVIPLRHLVEEKVKNKKIDTNVRKSIVADNCNAFWQFSQNLTKEARTKMAQMIVNKYPFLRQPTDPPEVRTGRIASLC